MRYWHFMKGEPMQEKKNGVKRLLNAIQTNIDDRNLEKLAKILNYHPSQLREDIEAISLVEVLNKDEIED